MCIFVRRFVWYSISLDQTVPNWAADFRPVRYYYLATIPIKVEGNAFSLAIYYIVYCSSSKCAPIRNRNRVLFLGQRVVNWCGRSVDHSFGLSLPRRRVSNYISISELLLGLIPPYRRHGISKLLMSSIQCEIPGENAFLHVRREIN